MEKDNKEPASWGINASGCFLQVLGIIVAFILIAATALFPGFFILGVIIGFILIVSGFVIHVKNMKFGTLLLFYMVIFALFVFTAIILEHQSFLQQQQQTKNSLIQEINNIDAKYEDIKNTFRNELNQLGFNNSESQEDLESLQKNIANVTLQQKRHPDHEISETSLVDWCFLCTVEHPDHKIEKLCRKCPKNSVETSEKSDAQEKTNEKNKDEQLPEDSEGESGF